MDRTLDEDALVAELVRRHDAHTVILFGSRARGDATPESDVDVLAVRATGGPRRDVTPWCGLALDVHVVDDAGLAGFVETHLTALVDARVLAEASDAGARLVATIRARLAQPRPALEDGARRAEFAWGDKMRLRIRQADPVLRAFRRAEVLALVLEAWSAVRGRWHFGPKATLRTLPADDPEAYAAYVAATRADAPAEAFDRLLDAVLPASLRPPERA